MTSSTGEITADLREPPGRGTVPADTFAIRLMLVRVHAGNLTIVDAAARVGVTNQSWSNWERGMMPRDLRDIVDAVGEEFGIDKTWLMYGGALAPEPRRRRTGQSLAERRRGLHHTDGTRPGSGVTAYKPGVTISAGRLPRGHRAPTGPADNRTPALPVGLRDRGRPVRLSGPLDV